MSTMAAAPRASSGACRNERPRPFQRSPSGTSTGGGCATESSAVIPRWPDAAGVYATTTGLITKGRRALTVRSHRRLQSAPPPASTPPARVTASAG